ncbi:MAG: hypothetical protein SGJ15_03840 [Bacteroidota bacterium]|nr:hypothetical protein [Bacteroidota bacterium]
MKKIGLLLVVFVFGFSFKIKLKPFEGTIKYSIDYHSEYGLVKYPQELIAYIKGDVIRIDVILPFAEISHIINCKKRTSLKFCTVDGAKYCVKSDLKKASVFEKALIAKDSIETIKNLSCSFGRVYMANSRSVVFFTTKYLISKNITDCGTELPYQLFFPHKEFETKLIMKRDAYDEDGETTYFVESITELPIKDADINPSFTEYKEVTEEVLGKIISDYFKSAR